MKLYNPEEVGMSSERLARMDARMEELVKDKRHPGIMTLAQRHGKVVHLGKYGLMDLEAGKPMQEDAIFRIYSMTKPIISVAAMILFEEGRLTLNDLVADYIPSFAESKVETEEGPVKLEPPLTLYHLITQTSGIGFTSLPFEQRTSTLAEAVEEIAKLPFFRHPGMRFSYSSNTDVLGYVIQLVADMPLEDFLEDRIFRPLRMTDTAFHVPPEKRDRLVQLYKYDAAGELHVSLGEGLPVGDVTLPTRCPSGSAGLVSTLSDYHAFCNCLIHNGKYEGGYLLSRKTLAWMTANHRPDDSLIPFNPHFHLQGFGMGFWVDTTLAGSRWITTPGQYGWGGAAGTLFWIDPAESFTAILMVQLPQGSGMELVELVRNLYYQAIVD